MNKLTVIMISWTFYIAAIVFAMSAFKANRRKDFDRRRDGMIRRSKTAGKAQSTIAP